MEVGVEDRVVVEIESELEPVVPEFLEKRRMDCDLLEHYLNAGDYSSIRLLGHRMKGTGGSYGFDEITSIGEIIEEGSLTTDTAAIHGAIGALRSYLERVEVAYV